MAVIFFPKFDSVNNAERERLSIRLGTPARKEPKRDLRRKLICIAQWRKMVLLALNEPSTSQ